MENTTCCLCGQEATKKVEENRTGKNGNNNPIWRYDCDRCGKFLINDYAIHPSNYKAPINPGRISAYTRKQTIFNKSWEYVICSDINQLSINNEKDAVTLENIAKKFPTTIQGRIDNALINLAKMSNFTGDYIGIRMITDYPIFYPDSEYIESAIFIAMQLINSDFIKTDIPSAMLHPNEIEAILSSRVLLGIMLTHKGWNRVAEIQSTNKNSKKVFVAMWFSDEMKEIFDVHIKPTIDGLGREYDTFHIAQKEHNNDITDEIIAGIKTSKFVIADLTGDRGGVYYEAGFARGLGIPVILTCREDWFKKTSSIKVNHSKGNDKEYPSTTIHFDVDHLNIIVWNTPEELSERLKNRILATID